MSITKKILKNTLSNWTGMMVNVVVLILLTPYLLKHLGDECYGIYQMIVPVVQYLVLLEFGLRGSIARFASGHIAAKDSKGLNSVISTTFYMCILLSVVIMLLCTALGFSAPLFFEISEEYVQQVLYMFWGMGLYTIMSFMGYSFGGILMGHHRFELINLQLIIAVVGKATLIIIFFSFGWVSLGSWALALVLSSMLGLIFLITMAFHFEPMLSLRLKHINIATFKKLFSFGSWNMLRQLSQFLIQSINPIIIGKYIGISAIPYYGIPFMIIRRLESLVLGLTSTLIPVASSNLSKNDPNFMAKLLTKGTYIASMIVFPLGFVLIVMCKDLFRVWLPEGYESSWLILSILMVTFLGLITQDAISQILLGGGKIRAIATIQSISSVAVIIFGIIFVGYFKFGLIGAALALVIPKMFDNILKPYYACKQVGISMVKYYLESYIRPVLCALPSAVMAFVLIHFLPPKNLLFWLGEFLIALLPYAIFAMTPILDWPLRRKILNKVADLIVANIN
jgi:O-antigen/teichoic acid export membrane protein